MGIRHLESKNSNYDYNNGGKFHTHHIYPISLYPEFGLELWNGVPLPIKWHDEFHSKFNRNGYLQYINIDWMGIIFDFIKERIKESNRDIITLNQWIKLTT